MIDAVLRDVESGREETVAGLKEFLRIPSVSTKPEHKEDLRRGAAWVAGKVNAMGLKAEVRPTGGHPAVAAKNVHKPGPPTVLFYGHHHLQPADPLDPWPTPPLVP